MAGEKDLPKPVIVNETCIAGRPQVKTQFIDHSLKELKQMLENTNPGAIEEVGRHWGKVNEILAGGEEGGVASLLDKAVDNVLEHWDGEAAESFEKKAREITQSLRNAAWYADLNRSQMTDAASQLRNYKQQLDDVKEPSTMDKLGDAFTDWKWDDGEAVAKDLHAGKMTAAQIAQADESKIGASRQAQLNGVSVMEDLAAQYMRVTGNLTRNRIQSDERGNIKEPSGHVEYPPPVTPGVVSASRPGASGSGSKPWSAGPTSTIKPTPTIPHGRGIPGNPVVPQGPGIHAGSQPPTVKTNVDGLNSLPIPGTGPEAGGFGRGAGSGSGIGGIPASGIAVPEEASSLGRSGIGFAGRGGLGGGGATAGRGVGGRAGMGGMGSGGAGAPGRGGAGLGGRGALARARGGVVGGAKGVTGKGGGGAGLHGSRGGSQRGAMAGGASGRKGRRSEEGDAVNERPDYLVEDEETWISEEDLNRNVPRTIE
ncbi:WXG100 family type VII secretion target [Streptomyces sp. NPDC096198]|uniref:WXG100 family type VII secretion target n=1 Tax=Streptomyces sp. NPDC096198 TaxID=3366080 RepID=UPI00381062BB